MNHAKKKREIAQKLYDTSIAANPIPGCIANFERSIRDLAMSEAGQAMSEGYNWSKSSYSFFLQAGNRDILLTAASRIHLDQRQLALSQ